MSVVELWSKGGLQQVDLPSGFRVRGKLPSVQDLVLAQVAPSELIARAMALAGKPIETFDKSERVTWIEWQRVQAAAFIREAFNPESGEWEPAVVTPAMLANGVPPEDVDALEDIVLRRRTPKQITAETAFLRGAIDADELKRVVGEEAAGTVNAWSAFRSEPAGDPGSANGADVGNPPVAANRAQRRRRGARSRPGAGDSPSS